jgi:D-glycero-alpha-D-manno-heptose-7-phosphate kinase
LKEKRGLHIHHDGDLPARTGLGSSSTFTVGILNALYALQGKIASKKQLAIEAIHVEQNLIKEHVGSQDQTIAAFGGFNKIEFNDDNNIEVHPMTLDQKKIEYFQDHIMMFFTGFTRFSSDVASYHVKAIPKKKNELKKMYEMVGEASDILNSNSKSFDAFGRLLDENWKLKRSLTGRISTPYIDNIYETAKRAGALGGKILGAGGGGFIMFFVKPPMQKIIKDKLKKLLYVPVRFDYLGSQIVYYKPEHEF